MMVSKPPTRAAKRRKKKDLQNDFKNRPRIDSFLLSAQNKKEEIQSVAKVLNLENEQEDTRGSGSEISELQIKQVLKLTVLKTITWHPIYLITTR